MNSTSKEKELFVLEPIFKKFMLPFIFVFFVYLPVNIFCITLPVLINCSYNAVFFDANVDLVYKIILFYLSFICYAYIIVAFPQLKIGEYYFFCDRLEIKPFLFTKKYIIYYNELHVVLYKNQLLGNKSLVVSKEKIPNFLKKPIKKIINEYIKGFYIIVHPFYLKDSSKIDVAIELLKSNAASFTVK